ncbi:MAG: VanZ family protein [bacterium]
MQNKKINLLKFIPAGLYNGIIWFFSNRTIPINITGCDKTLHILEYSILGFLLAFGLNISKNNLNTKIKGCFAFIFLAGMTDEIHQYFVPGRTSDILDFFADTTGGLLGILVWLFFAKILSFIKMGFFSKIK